MDVGAGVVPSEHLVKLRPELQGARGTIDELEDDDQVIVLWDGIPKPYRVQFHDLRQDPSCAHTTKDPPTP